MRDAGSRRGEEVPPQKTDNQLATRALSASGNYQLITVLVHMIPSVLLIFFGALAEELIKVFLTRKFLLTRGTWWSIFIFFSVESFLKLYDFFGSFSDNQYVDRHAILIGSGLVASSAFHITSSFLYAQAKMLVPALLFSVALHTGVNVYIRFWFPYGAPNEIWQIWFISTIHSVLLLVYFWFDRNVQR